MNTNSFYFLELTKVRKSYEEYFFTGNADLDMYDIDHIKVLRKKFCM